DFQTLETIVGPSGRVAWEALDAPQRQRIRHSVAHTVQIDSVIYPKTQAELSEVITWAYQNRWQVLPWGAGSKLSWGGVVGRKEEGGFAPLIGVSTRHLNRLIDHAVGDLTVTVEAGMGFTELQETLAQVGQFLAIDPAYPAQATIGGIVATGDTGSLRQRYNSVRDMLLGLSFVRADGQIAQAGGRVVKNVAGYDLMKLFTGSYGTLGIITQVTFRVYPIPEASQTLVLSGEAGAIERAVATLLRSSLTPTAADLLSASTVEDLQLGNGMALIVRFQSILPSVQEQTRRLMEVGQTLGLACVPVANSDEVTLWQRLREQMTDANWEGLITCKIGVRPTAAVTVLQQIEQLKVLGWLGQIHAASGLGRGVFAAAIPVETLLEIRALCESNSGFLSVLQAPVDFKQAIDVWGYAGNALDVMHAIKQQFDPHSLLSPHRFFGRI
ncbi:MAG: FAD-binding oxidoreductase, partial [Kovacikia sp.]